MPNSKFLEEYPLYRKFEFNFIKINNLNQLERVNINMECKKCKSVRTFNMINEYYITYLDPDISEDKPLEEHILVLRLKYLCAFCEEFPRYFLIKIDKKAGFIMKVGQEPSFILKADNEIKKALGKEKLIFFEKGLMSEYHGHGIAAFSYYRRVLEEIIGELLDLIPDLMNEEQKEEIRVALAKAKDSNVAERKIEFVKDLLPSILIIEGLNPLQLLYEELSAGMHGKTDEECLIGAEILREAMTTLISLLMTTKSKKEQLKKTLYHILDKRKKKIEDKESK